MIDAAKRAGRVSGRLEKLRRLHRRVLELQHGDVHKIDGMSVALLCSTHAAKQGFAITLTQAHGRLRLSSESIRTWVAWVARREEARPVWQTIYGRADKWTREAWKEYENARLG
jgi:hypothetical protein